MRQVITADQPSRPQHQVETGCLQLFSSSSLSHRVPSSNTVSNFRGFGEESLCTTCQF